MINLLNLRFFVNLLTDLSSFAIEHSVLLITKENL